MLALEDPGGDTLEKSPSGPMEIAQFLRIAIGLATVLSGRHVRGLIAAPRMFSLAGREPTAG
jgi:hypothetical protein